IESVNLRYREGFFSRLLEQNSPAKCGAWWPSGSPAHLKREVLMFVVRLKRSNEDFDFKTFDSAKAALARFRTAQQLMIGGELEQCALFDAVGAEAEHAVELVNQGKAMLIECNLDSDTGPPAPPHTT
ncbi:MAG: hypothetical protein ABJA75_17775, partial [Bradyrhizobium sp.]